jgi:hypothetical protein
MKTFCKLFVAIAVLALAGCGGLGKTLPVLDGPPDEYAELEQAEQAGAAAKISALSTATEAADGDYVPGVDVSHTTASGGMSAEGTTKKYPLSLVRTFVNTGAGADNPRFRFLDNQAPGTDLSVASVGGEWLSGVDGAEYGSLTLYAWINGTETAILNFDADGIWESSYWPTFNQNTTGSARTLLGENAATIVNSTDTEILISDPGGEDLQIDLDTDTDGVIEISSPGDAAGIDFDTLYMFTTGTIRGRISRTVADITTGTVNVSAADCLGQIIRFTGEATAVLPTASTYGYGLNVVFRIRDAAEEATIDVQTGEKIVLRGTALAAGTAIQATGAGEFVSLVSTTDTDGSGTDGWETWGITDEWASE